jgi:hypothetical protein
LGLNFAITPRTLPKEEIIQEIEPALSRLIPKPAVNQTRIQIAEVLRKAKLPKRNLNRNELKSLKDLKQDKSINILKADKGNATVVMDKTDYDQKVKEMLNTSTYEKIKDDPTASTERKVTKHLLDLRKQDSLQISTEDFTLQLLPVQNSTAYQKYTNPIFHSVQLSHQEIQQPTT